MQSGGKINSLRGIILVGICLLWPSPTNATVQVSGTVFSDSNRNGVLDESEKGLPGVFVSDGLDICSTDSQGCYQLETEPDKYPFVFVILPSGYASNGDFYQRIYAEEWEYEANFPLCSAPQMAHPDFSFVQITDIHIGKPPADIEVFSEDIQEINNLIPEPAFVVATGDLVDEGNSLRQYRLYKEAIKNFNLPLYNVIGNHDYQQMEEPDNYEAFLGPRYYSFNRGGKHFVALDCVAGSSHQQVEWLKKDLDLQPPDKQIIVFQHYYPQETKWLLDILSQYNTKAIITGHWHSNKLLDYEGIRIIQTPSLRFGGIDASARGFRVCSFQGSEFLTEEHIAGCQGWLAITTPARKGFANKRNTKVGIKANAYDACSPVAKVQYQADEEGWREMARVGKRTWKAEWDPAGALPGSHLLAVKATFRSGLIVKRKRTFQIAESPPSPKPNLNWPMFQHDPARSGTTADVVRPPLYLAWSQNAGGTIHMSSPIVYNDVVYIGVQDDDNIVASGVVALNARTGEIRWRYNSDASIKGTPAADNDLVYAVSVTGTLYALDAMTGKERWRYNLGDRVKRWVYSSPVVAQGVIYAGVAPYYVAVDCRTGEKLWQASSMGRDWISCYSSPAVGEEKVYVSFNWGKGLFALWKDDGWQAWNRSANTTHSSPALCRDSLFFAADVHLYAVDTQTGRAEWQFYLGKGWTTSSPAVSGSALYIGSTDGRVLAIDISSGEELWCYQTQEAIASFSPYQRGGSMVASSPAISGNVVYVGSNDGRFYALDAGTGQELWEYNLGWPVTSSPAISGNTVYIAADDGNVYAFTEGRCEN